MELGVERTERNAPRPTEETGLSSCKATSCRGGRVVNAKLGRWCNTGTHACPTQRRCLDSQGQGRVYHEGV